MNPQAQTEWGTRVSLDFFLGGAGSGLLGVYLVAHLLTGIHGQSVKIIVTGIALVLAGLLILLSELGRPANVMKSTKNTATSWMARGVIFNLGLIGSVLLLLLAIWCDLEVLVLILSLVTAGFSILVAVYPGVVLFSAKDIWVWRSIWLPALLLCSAFMSGLATLAITDSSFCFRLGTVFYWSSVGGMILVVALFAIFWSTRFSIGDSTARQQFQRVMRNEMKTIFQFGVVGIGMGLPLLCYAIQPLFPVRGAEVVLVIASWSCLIGAFALRYCVLKTASHRPITLLGQSSRS